MSCRRAPPPKPHYGAIMSEVGRRFEVAGRAALANRFELATFEVGEMGELFADLRGAEPPKEGTVPSGLADALVKTNLPELTKAATAADTHAFTDAFARTSASCNMCHQASGHGFIQISNVLGKSVPDVDPTQH